MSICAEHIFKGIFDRWQEPLQHFLQARGMSLESAADKVQDCFIRLWDNCSKVNVEKAKSFLFTTASNLQIDSYRKDQVRLKYKNTLSKSDIVKQDAQFLLEEKEFKQNLEHVINTMSPASKEVFLLHRFDNLSYKDISDALDISVKAVEKRMSKALKHLLVNKINLKR